MPAAVTMSATAANSVTSIAVSRDGASEWLRTASSARHGGIYTAGDERLVLELEMMTQQRIHGVLERGGADGSTQAAKHRQQRHATPHSAPVSTAAGRDGTANAAPYIPRGHC